MAHATRGTFALGVLVAMAAAASVLAGRAAGTLDIYWIDVEGAPRR
jgi:hypothetical protein